MQVNASDFIQQTVQSKLIHFDELAMQLYRYQIQHNEVFAQYLQLSNAPTNHLGISSLRFLPISFFKSHEVKTGEFQPQLTFTSSTTTGTIPSRHVVGNPNFYKQSYEKAFQLFYGDPAEYTFLFLLPNYLERSGSSLVYMAQGLQQLSNQGDSGFYLYDFEKLAQTIHRLKQENKRIFLLGVTFALLDFAEQFPLDLHGHVVMETGGMKGRKEELTRQQVHQYLKQQFNLDTVHAEYGMTELLSQAYSNGNGLFACPPWMRVVITDPNDPFTSLPAGKTGVINVIDLANVESCAFIQTQDLGKMHEDGRFEVLGRIDFSELRGCNLMYAG
jgi:hypothetical protein